MSPNLVKTDPLYLKMNEAHYRVLKLKRVSICFCRGHLLGQSFESPDHGRGPLQDENHSGSRPHSLPGLYLMHSGRAPEWFRSGHVVAGS